MRRRSWEKRRERGREIVPVEVEEGGRTGRRQRQELGEAQAEAEVEAEAG